MTLSQPWPFPSISKVELYHYLLTVVGVEPEQLVPLETLTAEPARQPGIDLDRTISADAAPEPAKSYRQVKPGNWDERAKREPILEDIGARFLQTLALPESRLQLAGVTGCSYDQITRWVIRADLLRITSSTAPAPEEAQHHAKILAEAGILGVHDLAEHGTAETPEKTALLSTLHEQLTPDVIHGVIMQAQTEARHTSPAIISATQAVLVVKGAGSHIQDETLSVFLKGFWPAVVHQYPNATLTEHVPEVDIDQPHSTQTEARTTDGRVAEIHAGEQRLWVKESYWEPGIRPPGTLPALLLEWRMATYVLGHVIWELFSPPNRKERRQASFANNVWRYCISFLCAHLLVLFPIAITYWSLIVSQSKIFLPTLFVDGSDHTIMIIIFTVGGGLLISLPPALDTAMIMEAGKREKPIEQLPGVAGWLLVTLIGGLLLAPVHYFLFLFTLIAMQVAQVIFRKIAWKRRQKADSDTDFSEWVDIDGKAEKVSKAGWVDRFVLTPWLYRYIIVIALPVIVLLILGAKLLKIIPGLAFVGSGVENFANATLSGGLGDVVIYANEPGEAAWIRGAIMADIEQLHTRADVKHIHIFAHSQGTPITFETLFYHLPGALRRKIRTYVTIGSVLNYFHQANWVLDLRFIRRFPRRPYPHQEFAPGFQWINFWNHTDPIPEFAALDAYEDFLPVPTFERNPASPTNIRTRGTLLPWTSHSEYWTNIDQVQSPFVERILHGLQLDGTATNGAMQDAGFSHAAILRLWIPVAVLLLVGGIALTRAYNRWLFDSKLTDVNLLAIFKNWIVGIGSTILNFLPSNSTSLPDLDIAWGVAWAIAIYGFLSWSNHVVNTIRRYRNRAY